MAAAKTERTAPLTILTDVEYRRSLEQPAQGYLFSATKIILSSMP